MEWINERHICILYKTKRIWAEICLCRRILLQCAKGWVPHNNTPTEKLLTIFSNLASNFPTYKKLVTSISTSCSMHFNFNAFISTCVECMWSWWKAFRNRNVALFTVINEFQARYSKYQRIRQQKPQSCYEENLKASNCKARTCPTKKFYLSSK